MNVNETKRANKASWYGEWQTGTLKESARGQDQETATPSTTQQDFAGFDDAVAVCSLLMHFLHAADVMQ